MKTLIIALLCFGILPLQAQPNHLKTESVELKSCITFILNAFPSNKSLENSKSINKVKSHHITFLLETHQDQFSNEDKTALKQAFMFLSERLTGNDKVSIAFYNNRNGLLLKQTPATDLKKILYAIDSGKLVQPFNEGISESFAYANALLNENVNDVLVFVRKPKPINKTTIAPINLTNTTVNKNNKNSSIVEPTEIKTAKSNTGHIVLLTAITLLPELINVIKD